jgi:hypothetical protein
MRKIGWSAGSGRARRDRGDGRHRAVGLLVGGKQRRALGDRHLLDDDLVDSGVRLQAPRSAGSQVEGPVAGAAVGDEVALTAVLEHGDRHRPPAAALAAAHRQLGDQRRAKERDQTVGDIALHPRWSEVAPPHAAGPRRRGSS